MLWDDLKKLLGESPLNRLDNLMTVKLPPLLQASGLAAIGLWAINHLVTGFAVSFTQGLWAVLETIGYGVFALVALRTACEIVLIFFKAQTAAHTSDRPLGFGLSPQDVDDAIYELAKDDPPVDISPIPAAPVDVDPLIKGTTRRRPVKRSPAKP
jgi:hypothetical protein